MKKFKDKNGKIIKAGQFLKNKAGDKFIAYESEFFGYGIYGIKRCTSERLNDEVARNLVVYK